MPKQTPTSTKETFLGQRLQTLRKQKGLNLANLAKLTGLSRSSLYKVENHGMSLTYDKLINLANGLEIDVSELFKVPAKEESDTIITARREVGRANNGYKIKTATYDYNYLCPDLKNKKLIPIFGTITAKSTDEFDKFISHSGEEFTYVIEGSIEVHTEHYATVELAAGDHIYLDSTMPHVFVSTSTKPAKVLTICTSPSEKTLKTIQS